jgi:hypothetical protein
MWLGITLVNAKIADDVFSETNKKNLFEICAIFTHFAKNTQNTLSFKMKVND